MGRVLLVGSWTRILASADFSSPLRLGYLQFIFFRGPRQPPRHRLNHLLSAGAQAERVGSRGSGSHLFVSFLMSSCRIAHSFTSEEENFQFFSGLCEGKAAASVFWRGRKELGYRDAIAHSTLISSKRSLEYFVTVWFLNNSELGDLAWLGGGYPLKENSDII